MNELIIVKQFMYVHASDRQRERENEALCVVYLDEKPVNRGLN